MQINDDRPDVFLAPEIGGSEESRGLLLPLKHHR